MNKLQLFGLCLGTAIGVGLLSAVFFAFLWMLAVWSRHTNQAVPNATNQNVELVLYLFRCFAWFVREFLRLFLWWVIP